MAIQFEWNERTDRANQRKHGISFERATQVFDDTGLLLLQDRIIGGEEQWHAIGLIEGTFLLVVVHTSMDDCGDEIVRIISARRAVIEERTIYEEQNG